MLRTTSPVVTLAGQVVERSPQPVQARRAGQRCGSRTPSVAPGTTGYVGDATVFVLEFSNGLTVYLTGGDPRPTGR